MKEFSLQGLLDLARLLPGIPDTRTEKLKLLPKEPPEGALYYRFLYELSLRYGPFRALEIGTYIGASSSHLAANPECHVTTVDINPDAARRVEALGIPNIKAATSDSTIYGKALLSESPKPVFDVLFIDGNHTFNQAYSEYETYRPLVRDGGLIIMDDVRLPMSTKEMDVFWEFVPDPKESLDFLHATGFGISKKDPSVRMPSWTEVIDQATEKMVR